MGFFSKKSEKEEEAARSSLFGKRSSAQPSENPYAAPPPTYQASTAPAPSASPAYAAPSSAYAAPSPYAQPPPIERTQSSATDRNRDALFAGRQQQQTYASPPPAASSTYAPPGAAGAYTSSYGSTSGYGADRQLTAEQEEDEDVESVKQQIRFTKQESVSSTRNALRVASQAEETGRNTLARLGTQGERLYNTEKNLDVAATHNRIAEERARELKTLNRGMFVPHVKNPMKSKSRAAAEEARILDQHQADRDEREWTRQKGYQGRDGVGRALNGTARKAEAGAKMSMTEKSKYQFEADESDDEKEKEIHSNLDQLGGITSRLHGLAVATGEEVDRQNKQIGVIMKKSDGVDDQIALTHSRLKRIR